jgi:formate hydrogenlyase subunit 4
MAQGAMAVVVGIVESSMARLRLRHLPQLLTGAIGLSAVAVVLALAR